jgi:hypothetical protein
MRREGMVAKPGFRDRGPELKGSYSDRRSPAWVPLLHLATDRRVAITVAFGVGADIGSTL